MPHNQNINIEEENEFRKITNLILKNYRLFIISVFTALVIAFSINRYSIPTYSVSSSILIKGSNPQPGGGGSTSGNQNDFIYSNLFGSNQNFQNELWIMKSYPVIEKTVRNLDLSVTYYYKGRFNFYEAYKNAPFKVSFLPTHPQPLDIKFTITFLGADSFNITAESKRATFFNFESNTVSHRKEKWVFEQNGKFGELIETPDLAFIIDSRDTTRAIDNSIPYGFKFSTINSISGAVKSRLEYTVVDRQATVINITLITESLAKGVDIVNELMSVYSDQNLERKNYLATITVDYIEDQLNQI